MVIKPERRRRDYSEHWATADSNGQIDGEFIAPGHQFARPISTAAAGTVMVRTRNVSSRRPMPTTKLPCTTLPMLANNRPNIDAAKFEELAGKAKANCPISRVLNATITLDAKLV